MIQEFAIPTILMSLIFLGVLIRKIPVIQKTLIPAPILGGIVGFVLMNTGVLQLDYKIFEKITFHLFTLSFISITYMSINTPRNENKGIFKGGLWLALIFGLMISIQAFLGSSIYLVIDSINKNIDLQPALGGMIAHGFAQGPGQAVAIGTIWEGFNVTNAIQYGLFYSAVGYLFAFMFGIPFAKILFSKKLLNNQSIIGKNEKKNFESGLIINREKNIFGYQTAHHSNIDTLSLHFSLIGVTYFLAYGFAELLTKFIITGPTNKALIFGNMFVWGILFSFLIKKILIKVKLSYIIDTQIQGSVTGFLVDFLVLSSLLSINLKLIYSDLIPLIITALVVGIATFFIVLFFARKSGAYEYERFMAEYGIVTGTAATGLLLLRVVDPKFSTPVAKELVWWNILNLPVGIIVFLSQIALPVTNFWLWYVIVLVSIIIFLILLRIFRFWGAKHANA